MMTLHQALDFYADAYNRPSFIADDPISLPHRFTRLQDIEIIGFWVAMLAWGRRSAIMKAGEQLIEWMDGAPHDFILHHGDAERRRWERFYYRTFQSTDALYFLAFLQQYYQQNETLETAFSRHLQPNETTIESALKGFHTDFFSLPYAPDRTRKHVSTPTRNSSCKRLCLFLRWMVRRDDRGVDFGLWRHIQPSQLVLPLDVHVLRVARDWGLLAADEKPSWKTALQLTERLRPYDPADPVRYDFALFGKGVSHSTP